MQHFLTRKMNKFLWTGLLAAALAGCAQSPPSPSVSPPGAAAPTPAVPAAPTAPGGTPSSAASAGLPHYKCDQGIEFTVRFFDDTAVVDAGPRGNDVLLRDAGGTTPQQTVFSNARMRAEFGLGADGREALLHYASPALQARCVRG
jgi:hypothetical protein